MKFFYYLLWPVIAVVSLFGGIIIGFIGITIGHFQDMILDVRREYIEYTKYYDYKKAQFHETLYRHTKKSLLEIELENARPGPMLASIFLMICLDCFLYPFYLIRYIVVAPGRLFAVLDKWMKNGHISK